MRRDKSWVETVLAVVSLSLAGVLPCGWEVLGDGGPALLCGWLDYCSLHRWRLWSGYASVNSVCPPVMNSGPVPTRLLQCPAHLSEVVWKFCVTLLPTRFGAYWVLFRPDSRFLFHNLSVFYLSGFSLYFDTTWSEFPSLWRVSSRFSAAAAAAEVFLKRHLTSVPLVARAEHWVLRALPGFFSYCCRCPWYGLLPAVGSAFLVRVFSFHHYSLRLLTDHA